MLVNGKHYQSIWLDEYDHRVVKYINQHHLPFRFVIDELRSSDDVYMAIREMKVRGAPLIGAAAAFGVYLAALESTTVKDPAGYIRDRAEKLAHTRPTAVNLAKAIARQLGELTNVSNPEELIRLTLKTSLSVTEEEKQACFDIGLAGLPLIEGISRNKGGAPVNILTHCNAGWLACIDYGTATAPVYLAHDKGINVHVWVDETRPRNQGSRLTAWELGQHGVPHTVIVDNTGGHLMQHGMVDLVLVGSDRTTRTGDVANKIGTYLKALAAKDNRIPFYVALPSTSIDFSMMDGLKDIPIEVRDEDEVRYLEGEWRGERGKIKILPDESPVANYGFDVTPARLVTGLITERGICQANQTGIKKLFSDKFNS